MAKRIKRRVFLLGMILLSLTSLLYLSPAILHATNEVEWSILDDGGDESASGSYKNSDSAGHLTVASFGDLTTNGNVLSPGYVISIPLPPSANCTNNSCVEGGFTNDDTFTFQNASGCSTPPCEFYYSTTNFKGVLQYYQYVWTTNSSTNFGGASEWSDDNAKCPGGSCYYVGTSIDLTATPDGPWYLHLRSYLWGLQGGDIRYGPYNVDTVAPSNPIMASVVQDNGTCSGSALDNDTWQAISSDPCFTWNEASDPSPSSGIEGYWVYYGDSNTSNPETAGIWTTTTNWTNGDPPNSGADGIYYFRIETKDNAGNKSAAETKWTIKYDTTDPVFNDIAGAYPAGNLKIELDWSAASDIEVPPASNISYRVYQTTNPGNYNFSSPDYTTSSSTGCTVGDAGDCNASLTVGQEYCYVVRAKDMAGNESDNSPAGEKCATAVSTIEFTGVMEGHALHFYDSSWSLMNAGVVFSDSDAYLVDTTNHTIIDQYTMPGGESIQSSLDTIYEDASYIYFGSDKGKLYKLKYNDPGGDDITGDDSVSIVSGYPIQICLLSGYSGTGNCDENEQITSEVMFAGTGPWFGYYDPDYTTTNPNANLAIGIDYTDGSLEMETFLFSSATDRINSRPGLQSGSPSYLFIGSDDDKIYKINTTTWAVVATTNVNGDVNVPMTMGWYGLSAGCTDGGSGAQFYYLDYTDLSAKTGFPYPDTAASGTPIGTVNSGAYYGTSSQWTEIFFGDDDGRVHCVKNDGTKCSSGWPILPESTAIRTRVYFYSGVLYFSNQAGRVYAYDIDSGGGNPAQIEASGYPYKFNANINSTLWPNKDKTKIMVGTDSGNLYFLPMLSGY